MGNTLENIKEFFRAVIDILTGKTPFSTNVTIKWLKNKIKDLLAKKNIAKVAVMKVDKLIEECPDQGLLEDLRADGYSFVIASVNANGEVVDVELVKDEGNDPEVYEFLGEDGMVVVQN